MKIGILTYHRAHNYGAVLQCYALQEFLKELGHDVSVIDYRPSYIRYGLFTLTNWVSWNLVKTLRKIYFQLQTFSKQIERSNGFNNFVKLRLQTESLNLDNPYNDYNCFVVGSDQVWRKNKHGFDKIYWGNFGAAKGHRLITYAASMGGDKPTNEETEKIALWLQNFSAINVREDSLKELIKPLTNQNIEVTIDPVFLLTAQQWQEIEYTSMNKRKYILIYQVISNPAPLLLAKQIARHTGWEIIEISSKVTGRRTFNLIETASPEEFLWWMHNASLVITTSFHGTAFSLIYQKPFICIKLNKPSDIRIVSLLAQFCLLDHFVDCNHMIWDKAMLCKPILSNVSFIENSKKILRKSLE